MTATFSETKNGQTLVYVRGVLIMKRWNKTQVSVLFGHDNYNLWSTPKREPRAFGTVAIEGAE